MLTLFPVTLSAQRPGVTDLINALPVDAHAPKVYYFPIDRYVLMPGYRTNRVMLDALDSLMRDPLVINNTDTIEIFGACSPIASEEYNRILALRRANALLGYLREHFPDAMDKISISIQVIGIDHEGYYALKFGRYDLTEKQIWDLLQYASVRFKMKDGTTIPASTGSPFKEIAEPESEPEPEPEPEPLPEPIPPAAPDTLEVAQPDTLVLREPKSGLTFALKTNLLYDLALLPGLALEIPFGQWSALVYGHWSWWDTKAPNYWSHRIQWAGAGLRFHWGNTGGIPLTGHFIGLYASGGTYDVRLFTRSLDDLGYLSNRSWSAGATYGYSIPIGSRWNMELNLSAGHFAGLYYEYNRSRCADCYPLQATGNRNYFGLTGAEINFVYRFGGPVYNKHKNTDSSEYEQGN
jgi:hypothetical protein